MLIFKKEKEARKLVLAHLDEARDCLIEARETVHAYLSKDIAAAAERADAVGVIETRADRLVRQVREALLDGAFLPNIRSDVYRLVQAVEAVAGMAEESARFVAVQSPRVPDEYAGELKAIMELSVESFAEFRKALRNFLKPKGSIESLHEHVARVCELETEVDVLETDLTRKVFASTMDHSDKLHLAQFIGIIGRIADLAEDAADELEFAAMKAIV